MTGRTLLDEAIAQLRATAKTCPVCGRQFVYGRSGAVYCSRNCATLTSTRAFRSRQKTLHKDLTATETRT
jgi:hypothetical protein